MPSIRVIGPGRAGTSLYRALLAAGWQDGGLLGRADPLADAARDVDLLVVATPDTAVRPVAAAVRPVPDTVIVHLSGMLGLDVLIGHPRVGSVHPLVAMPDAERGAERLAAGAWFAVAGDPLALEVVAALGGHAIEVADDDRVRYHAAAAIASNHLVALLGQVDRVAATVGVPLEAYLDLVRVTVDNVAALGPAAALTGPVARGDWDTVEAHRAALPPEELAAYDAMVEAARRLVEPPGRP